MGNLNARTPALAPTVEGQLLCMSTDKVLNTGGRALLSLLTQQKLVLLSGTTQLSYQATSLGGGWPQPSPVSGGLCYYLSCCCPLGHEIKCG